MSTQILYISGQALQRLRLLKGIKQTSIAHSMHITQQAYSKIEKLNRVDGERLNKLLNKLNYTIEELENLRALITTSESSSNI